MAEKYICEVCKKEFANMAPYASHCRAHVKKEEMTETLVSGKVVFTKTGKKVVKIKDYQKYKVSSTKRRESVEARSRVEARSDIKGNIKIKCKMCGKWIDAFTTKEVHKTSKDGKKLEKEKIRILNYFVDERFVKASCCNTVTLLPVRLIQSVLGSSDKVIAV